MTLKDWVDLFTGGGAAISAIAAGVAAWAARTSAKAAEQSSEASHAAINSNERIADNDRRIRLMEERMRVWRAFDDLMNEYQKTGRVEPGMLSKAHQQFQLAPFVFPAEIDRYLAKLNRRMWWQFVNEHRIAQRRWQDLLQEGRHREQLKELYLMTWLGNQQRDGKKIFQKHMSLID